jgi:MerR family transcriptional regulator, light-induced transcriptional regulator
MSSSGLAREERPETARVVIDFTDTILSADESAPGVFVRALLRDGMSPSAILEQVFAPAARILGERWESDDCSFYEVTIASGHIQRLVRAISPLFLSDRVQFGSMGRMLLTCAPGEQHTLGTLIVAEHFIRDGWDVHLMTIFSSDILLDMVRKADYDCLGVSVSCSQYVPGLRSDIRRVRQVSRNADIRVLVGGHLFGTDSSLVQQLGADGFATDADSAVVVARRLRGVSELSLG